MQHHTHRIGATLLSCAVAGAALAAGNHGGGHDHGAEVAVPGQPGEAAHVSRTITIAMDDTLRYTPSSIRVRPGETVHFVVRNLGQIKHEMSLGTEQSLREHLEVMRKFPDMEHAEPSQVTVAPGGTGEIVWRFTRAGTVHFGCLMPGHYEAGMQGKVRVQPR